jgi:alpha-beta hydrolase superfamily lysophospholipase
MAIPLIPTFKKAYYSLVLFGGLYVAFLFALTLPVVQRAFIYAHIVSPSLSSWQDLSDVQAFGFLPHQVQPFTIKTPDNETLYAWHILPLHLVYDHSGELLGQNGSDLKSSIQVVDTVAFKLLASDPNAHVVVNFRGNTAHLASFYRPFTYQRLLGLSSKTRPVHVIAFDYRGFGYSTGTPTEEGLITDSETILSFLTGIIPQALQSEGLQKTLHIPPSSIILTSQSLGTAVSTALLHRWAVVRSLPPFRALILTSPFRSIRTVVESYSIKGLIPPLLSPIRSYPLIMDRVTGFIVDTWDTSSRLAALIAIDTTEPISASGPINIHIIHARDDRDIPSWESDLLWTSIVPSTNTSSSSSSSIAEEQQHHHHHQQQQHLPGSAVPAAGDTKRVNKSATSRRIQTFFTQSPTGRNISVRYTRTSHGGHDSIGCSEDVGAAVWLALESPPHN